MEFVQRMRGAVLCAAFVLLPGCVIAPTGWDARTNGGRNESPWDDPYRAGQPGVEDMRAGSQNDWGFFYFSD